MNTKWKLFIIAESACVISLVLTYLVFFMFQKPAFFSLLSLANYQSFIVWTFIFSGFSAFSIYYLFARKIDNVNQLLAQLIEKNEYTERFNVQGTDSIAMLTEQINTIMDNIHISDEKLEHEVNARTQNLLERIDDIEVSLSHREKEKKELIVMNEHLTQMAHLDKLTSLPMRVLVLAKHSTKH